MLTLYPSNRLEYLSVLLATLLREQQGSVLSPQTILVESPGMQHWLNMQLAKQSGLAMNLNFPLSVRFMWDTARLLLSDDAVPRQSPYRREVLAWRIDALFQDEDFLSEPSTQSLVSYWSAGINDSQQSRMRLQLAIATADLFEQYLLYRPDWLFAWEANQSVVSGNTDEAWQSRLWRFLVAQNPNHPARIHQLALEQLRSGQKTHLLPKSIVVFAINTMAPQLIEFLDALASHIDVHFFHLNPSESFWGNVQSDKARARQMRQQSLLEEPSFSSDNPLLANLGQQGRDLFNLLCERDSTQISVFEGNENVAQETVLSQLQRDILRGERADGSYHTASDDRSITLSKAHSALREVQALHDYLLEQFNRDATLQPRDVLVMCPAIEQYSPYINAVFERSYSQRDDSSQTIRIRCSIADRTPLDSQPLIAAFIELLALPDSRFEVNAIVDHIRHPAVQQRYQISDADLQTLEVWLVNARVHWGYDAEHKAQISQQSKAKERNSWEWGLKRLLLGLACQDSAVQSDTVLTVPDVEGQQAVLLGKLVAVVKNLRYYSQSLSAQYAIEEWEEILLHLREDCFFATEQDEDAYEQIGRACAELVQCCQQAQYSQKLTLAQIRDLLVKKFSSPDPGNQFLTGQVTFCSMLPMRSIPFRIVAILGLNDGEFPRQSVPSSIDLMRYAGSRMGDRSRRAEDRYLFLEALISARESLYLSYQAKSAKDNTERQPSLVLGELLTVLERDYHWQSEAHARNQALHPFSPNAFMAPWPVYDQGWYQLANQIANVDVSSESDLTRVNAILADSAEHNDLLNVDCRQVARAFENPLKHYANKVLNLYLDELTSSLSDVEPFAETHLLRYQVLEGLMTAGLQGDSNEDVVERFRLDGVLPATPLADELIQQWREVTDQLLDEMPSDNIVTQYIDVEVLGITCRAHALQAEGQNEVFGFHTGSQNAWRKLEQYLTHLCFCVNELGTDYRCYYFDKDKVKQQLFPAVDALQARETLELFFAVYHQINRGPLCVHVEHGLQMVDKAKGQDVQEWPALSELQSLWDKAIQPNKHNRTLGEDEYFKWFYPSPPTFEQLPLDKIAQLYNELNEALKSSKGKRK